MGIFTRKKQEEKEDIVSDVIEVCITEYYHHRSDEKFEYKERIAEIIYWSELKKHQIKEVTEKVNKAINEIREKEKLRKRKIKVIAENIL